MTEVPGTVADNKSTEVAIGGRRRRARGSGFAIIGTSNTNNDNCCHRHRSDVNNFLSSSAAKLSPARLATFAIVVASLFGSTTSFTQSRNNVLESLEIIRSQSTISSSMFFSSRRQTSTNEDDVLSSSSGSSTSLPPSSSSIPPLSVFDNGTDLSLFETRSLQPLPIPLEESFRQIRQHVLDDLRTKNDYETACVLICGMVDYLREVVEREKFEAYDTHADDDETESTPLSSLTTQYLSISTEERRVVSEIIDETMQAFFARAFNAPYRGIEAWERVGLAIDLLQLQLSSSKVLVAPYDTVPKGVLVRALQAVTGLLEGPPPRYQHQRRSHRNQSQQQQKQNKRRISDINPDIAFRILQRLVTGVGMRNYPQKMRRTANDLDKADSAQPKKIPTAAQLYEVDFNRVLNVYSNLGKMDMAHRVIALQERTPHAPSLSPVTYSILLKGYGKLGDWNNIDMLIRHGAASGVKPDTILFNSLMDAYINCGQIDKARTVFNAMKKHRRSRNGDQNEEERRHEHLDSDESSDFPFSPEDCPVTNTQTYNTLLKGLTRQGLWNEAQSVATEMEQNRMWDHVTTNTLVQAACKARDFSAAETLLAKHTTDVDAEVGGKSSTDKEAPDKIRRRQQQQRQHPNADAYTSLMDAFGKDGRIEKAIALLRLMKDRNVEANEFHYSSLIGALARSRQVEKAHKMLSHVRSIASIGDHPVVYNSFISGLVHHSANTNDIIVVRDHDYDRYVDEALAVLRTMIERQVHLDASTVAVILDGFGRCYHPRVIEAVTLVEKLETEHLVPRKHIKICTALLRVFAAANDLEGVIRTFRKIQRPDMQAVNAFLDAAVRCGNNQVANETFQYYFGLNKDGRIKSSSTSSSVLEPDVISYTTLIRAALAKGTLEGSREARNLYEEMKFQRRIFPDKVLVNVIIRGLVEASRTGVVQASDARFAAGVLRDAGQLDWDDGQLESRKRVTELAMRKCVGNVWDEEAGLYGLWKDPSKSSRFSSSSSSSSSSITASSEEEMFERHGWNQVDSGFQLWGAGKNVEPPPRQPTTDKFLQSKGWNDMESGFRII
jgi:pentatricopeptide repeat protein